MRVQYPNALVAASQKLAKKHTQKKHTELEITHHSAGTQNKELGDVKAGARCHEPCGCNYTAGRGSAAGMHWEGGGREGGGGDCVSAR